MSSSRYPVLFQLNTRVYLQELAGHLRRPVTLKNIPEELLDLLETNGFNWFWSLGVWTTGSAGQEISRTNPVWREEFQKELPDLEQSDICGFW